MSLSPESRRLLIIGAGVALTLATGYAVYRWWWHRVERMVFMGTYGSGVACYDEALKRRLPDTLEELEAACNTPEYTVGRLPYSNRWPRPIYRPVGSLEGGPYIVIVESPSPYWYDWGRYLIFAMPDGKDAEVRFVSWKEADELIARDDRRREGDARATTGPSRDDD